MKVVIIGSGNVATVLGKKISAAGHDIIQVVSRSLKHAEALASAINATALNNLKSIDHTSDIYLITVADNAIESIATELPFTDKLVIHTAGSVSKKVLARHKNYGVLYPLQSIRKEMAQLPEIPVMIDGSSEEVIKTLTGFTAGWASSTSILNDEKRLKIHVAAVFASNFTNHLYTITEEFCKKEGVDFNNLLPLIKETAVRLNQALPSTLQTGPAVRNDTFTINKHLDLLASHPELKNFYTLFSDSIAKHYKVVK